MSTPYSFRPAGPDDEELISRWFGLPHVMEFWGDVDTNTADFRNTLSGENDLFNYLIGQDGEAPFCLLITTNAATGEPEHLLPHLPETGDAWTLDVLIGPPEYRGRGIAVPMITSFLHHAQRLCPSLQVVFIDPEANNPRAIHVYEKAGFRRIAEFTPSDGRFQGQPHVLLAYHFH
ncbi:MAG: GNAT family N-acetyltransferase [Rhodospirillales bacterium]|nr:GNAT family N-acetyltransferase [Rhodospirillales bacterium]